MKSFIAIPNDIPGVSVHRTCDINDSHGRVTLYALNNDFVAHFVRLIHDDKQQCLED